MSDKLKFEQIEHVRSNEARTYDFHSTSNKLYAPLSIYKHNSYDYTCQKAHPVLELLLRFGHRQLV